MYCCLKIKIFSDCFEVTVHYSKWKQRNFGAFPPKKIYSGYVTIENGIFESPAHLHRLCLPPQQIDCMDVVYIEYDRFNHLSNSGFPSFTNKSFAFY